MDHRQALRLLKEIELRLAFLGVDLDECLSVAEKDGAESASPRSAAPKQATHLGGVGRGRSRAQR